MEKNLLYGKMCAWYGITPLSFDEEIALPETKRKTRGNKITIIDNCENIKRYLDSIENSVRCAPELDDERHSELINEIAENIKRIAIDTEKTMDLRYKY